VLKSVSEGKNAGVLFCRSSGFNGYYLTISNGKVALYKYVNGGGGTIYYENSVDLNPSDNKFTVSKQESEIHLSVNDIFHGKITDATYSSGDVSLLIPNGTSAVFGAFYMTDEFTEGKPRAYFADNFDNGRSKYWKYLSDGGDPEISDVSGALNVKTGSNVTSWMYVDLAPTDFEVRVDVRHVAGAAGAGDKYGIVLLGDAPSGATVPMVHFGITGNKSYSIWSTNDETIPAPQQSTAIKGSAGPLAVEYIDTLQVKKVSGSSKYEFIVNGRTLSTDYPVVGFQITRIGIFTDAGMTIAYDNFEAKKEGAASIKFDRNPQQTIRGGKVIKNAKNVFYDLRGRKRYAANPQATDRTIRAAGVYVNQNGRELLTDKNKRARSK
jgi:hypothetical protein